MSVYINMSETYSLIISDAIMVSPSSISILLTISICLLLRFSYGHSLRVEKSTVGTDDVKLQASERRTVKAEEVDSADEIQEIRTRFGGRKLETGTRLRSESQHGANNGAASSTISSRKVHCMGSGESKGGVKRELSKGSRGSMRVNMSDFVSWNADYNVPRPHPPRNNR